MILWAAMPFSLLVSKQCCVAGEESLRWSVKTRRWEVLDEEIPLYALFFRFFSL